MNTGNTTIDTPYGSSAYQSETSTHRAKKRIRVPKKLKEKLSSYVSGSDTQGYYNSNGDQSYTNYSYSRPDYSNTSGNQYSYSTGQSYMNDSTYSSYTRPSQTGYSYGTGGSYTTGASYSQTNGSYATGQTDYSTTGQSLSGYSTGERHKSKSKYATDSYSRNGEKSTVDSYQSNNSYTDEKTKRTDYSYTNGKSEYSYSSTRNSEGGSYTDEKAKRQTGDSYTESTTYSVFGDKTTEGTNSTKTKDSFGTLSQTTDDSVTRRVHMKLRVKSNKTDERTKKRQAAKILLHRNGVVAPTDIKEESIDAVTLNAAETNDLSSLELSSKLEVPFKKTYLPTNKIKEVKVWDDAEDSELTLVDARGAEQKDYNSRFLGHHQDSESDSELSTTLDTFSSDNSGDFTLDTVPSVIGVDDYNKKYKSKEADDESPADTYAKDEAARRKLEDRRRKREEYQLAVEEAYNNGEEPPPSLQESETSDLTTGEMEYRIEQEMAELERILKDEEENATPLNAMLPGNYRDPVASKLESTMSSESSVSNAPAYEIKENLKKKDIGYFANQMALFGSRRPMSHEQVNAYDVKSDEYKEIEKSHNDRRKSERAKRRGLSQTSDVGSSESSKTTESSKSSVSVSLHIDPAYTKQIEGDIKKVRQRPKRGTTSYTTTETYTTDSGKLYSNVPTSGVDTVLVTANPTSAEFAETSNTTGADLFVEIPGTTTSGGMSQTDGLTTQSALVTANSSSANYVEVDSNNPNAQRFVEVPATTSEAFYSQTDGLTTQSALITANSSSADFVEVNGNSKGARNYVEVPVTADSSTELVTDYITGTTSTSGKLYVEEDENSGEYEEEDDDE